MLARLHSLRICLVESKGVAAPADGGLVPLMRPQPDLGQQRIAPDRMSSYPACPKIQQRIVLHQHSTGSCSPRYSSCQQCARMVRPHGKEKKWA